MYKDKIYVSLNHNSKLSKRVRCLFESGICDSALHKKIDFLDEVFSSEVYKLKILSSSSKEKLILEAKKQDPKKHLLLCFKGSDSDFLYLKEAMKSNQDWKCILLDDSVQYEIDVYWDNSSYENFFCRIISISKSILPVKNQASPEKIKALKPKEKKDVNVDLPKPSDDKKTDK